MTFSERRLRAEMMFVGGAPLAVSRECVRAAGMSGAKRSELVPHTADNDALLPHAKRSKTDGDTAVNEAHGAAFFNEEATKVEALLKSGTTIDVDAAKNDIEAVLAAGGTRIPPAHAAAHGCLHDVVRPPGWTPDPKAGRYDDKNPAKVYPFRLDTFQQKSVEVMEQRESVMVAAHTSAGKTVVAEYAIAMALRDGQRVVYTSPLKALSNQKFRELKEEFTDVGLMTGDTVINETASCLVMTTEVLRSMLYRGGEVMREVGWVIFDEIITCATLSAGLCGRRPYTSSQTPCGTCFYPRRSRTRRSSRSGSSRRTITRATSCTPTTAPRRWSITSFPRVATASTCRSTAITSSGRITS